MMQGTASGEIEEGLALEDAEYPRAPNAQAAIGTVPCVPNSVVGKLSCVWHLGSGD